MTAALSRLLVATGAAAIALPAFAQVAPPSQADISRARVGLPPPEAPQLDLRIQSPERAAVPRAIDAVAFTLKRVIVTGADTISNTTAEGYFAGVIDRSITLEEVRLAADRLEATYRARGYFLTRVFIPPQRLADGTLTVRVIEGRIDAIEVRGLTAAAQGQARAILSPLTQRTPINLASVERRLLILNDLPGLSAQSVLRPGATLGASTLVVTLARQRDTIQANANNTNSDLLGPWVYSAAGTLNRPLGAPGAINLSVGASGPGFGVTQSVSGRYAAGIGSSGIVASIGALYAEARPRGALRPLDIRNTIASYTARLRYPLIRSRAQSLFVEGGATISRARTDVLGQRLITDNTTVVDIGLLYQQSGWLGGTTVATLGVFRALPLFDAAERDAAMPSVLGFDPHFTRLTYGVQRVQPILQRISAVMGVQGQYTRSKLLTGEQIAFGGPRIGRAYDPSQITGDRGFGGFAEVRVTLPVDRPWLASAEPYAFIDGARTTSLATPFVAKTTQRLGSIGGGIRLTHRYGSIDGYVAQALYGVDARRDTRAFVSLTLNN